MASNGNANLAQSSLRQDETCSDLEVTELDDGDDQLYEEAIPECNASDVYDPSAHSPIANRSFTLHTKD